MATSANPFDAVIAQAQGGQGAGAPAPQPTAPAQQPAPAQQQPQPSGNPFDAVLQQAASTQQPEQDTFWNRVKHVFHGDSVAQTTGYVANQGEQDKSAIYNQAATDFHAGNYRKAATDLLDLFNPNKNAAAAESQKQMAGGAVGIAKGVGQTAMAASQLGEDVGTLGLDRVFQHQGEKDLKSKINTALTPTDDNQKAGANMEAVLEFMMGDAALKGLSVAEKLAQGSKVAKFFESFPRLANVVGDAIRGGTVGGVVGGAHGGATGAVEGALGGAAFEGGTSALGEVAGAVKSIPARANVDAPAEALRSNVKDTAADVADEAGVTPKPVESVRDAFGSVGDELFQQSKANYKLIDDATSGRWQQVENGLKATSRRIRNAETEEALTEAFGDQQELLDRQEAVLKEAEAAGVPKETVDNARATWRQANALKDLEAQVQLSTQGRAGVSESEEVDAKKLVPRLHKLYDAGRLQDALGSEDGAQEFIAEAEAAGKSLKAAQEFRANVKQMGKRLMYGLGTGAGIGGGYAIGKSAATILSGGERGGH